MEFLKLKVMFVLVSKKQTAYKSHFIESMVDQPRLEHPC